MVLKLDVQVATDIWQLGWVDIPLRPRDPNRALEGRHRAEHPVGLATGVQHTPVERRLVRGEELGSLQVLQEDAP